MLRQQNPANVDSEPHAPRASSNRPCKRSSIPNAVSLASLTDIERQLSTRNRQGITTPIRRIRMTNPRRLKMARRRRRHKDEVTP